MPIPGQSLTVRDPGLGLVPESVSTPLYMGVSSIGTVNILYSFSNKADAIDTLGEGPLVEAVCHALDMGGGPVLAMRLTGGTVGTNGAVTPTRTSTSTGTITVAGAPFDSYRTRVVIVATGANGAARFKYSLDGGITYSEELTVPSGGTYAVPRTNMTLTFVPGAGPIIHEAGDLHSFDSVAPLYTTANLATGMTALLALTSEFAFIVLTGEHATGAAAATMFAAFDTHLTSLATQFRYVRGIMDAGTDTAANVITAFAAVADQRICVCYGDADMPSSKAFAGWGTPRLPSLVLIAGRAHGNNGSSTLISTDLARFPEGPVNAIAITHDEFRTEVLDQHKISTLRTWQGAPGIYITNALLKSPAGSDFKYWQHGRCMDVACDTTVKTQRAFISTSVRTISTGAIDGRDAVRIEETVKNALRAKLISPNNAEGTPGHVSAFGYKIDRTNDVLRTFELRSKVAIQPLGYAKRLTTEIGYATIAEAA
jgi:hypothetical protein